MAGRDLFAADAVAGGGGRNLFSGDVPAMQPTFGSPGELSWSEVGRMALKNAPASAGQFISDMTAIVREPVTTVKAVGNLGLGVLQKAVPGRQESEKYADAVGQFIIDRYGGVDNVKRTIATDPVGFAADVSTLLSGGGTLAAKAPGTIGRVGKTVAAVGRVVDPAYVAAKGAGAAGKYVAAPTAKAAFGTLTGAGGQAIGEAAKAGRSGGRAAQAFTDQMRGIAPVDDVVTEASRALDKMKAERGASYRAQMQNIGRRADVIDFGPIDNAVSDILGAGTYKGQVINPKSSNAAQEIASAVDNWKSLDPTEFHTPEGLDALKKQIYDIGSSYDPMTQKNARRVADQVYNAVKGEIVKQAPEYAAVMKDYERASEIIGDIERTLSVNPKANVDTAVRKLQSVMRNNANTNYGRRESLARHLEGAGAENLFPMLSGQALSSLAPRGIQGAGTALSTIGIGTGIMSGTVNPLALMLIPATSPRVVGEVAYGAGRAGKAAERLFPYAVPAYRPAMYSGRLSRELENK